MNRGKLLFLKTKSWRLIWIIVWYTNVAPLLESIWWTRIGEIKATLYILRTTGHNYPGGQRLFNTLLAQVGISNSENIIWHPRGWKFGAHPSDWHLQRTSDVYLHVFLVGKLAEALHMALLEDGISMSWNQPKYISSKIMRLIRSSLFGIWIQNQNAIKLWATHRNITKQKGLRFMWAKCEAKEI